MKTPPIFRLLPRLLNLKKDFVKISLFVISAVVLLGCSYYKAKKSPLDETTKTRQIEDLDPEEKYVIIHSGNRMMNLKAVTIDEDERELRGTLSSINQEHKKIRPEDKKTYRYKRREIKPFNEVHFYTNKTIDLRQGEEISLPFSVLDSVSVNNPNTGRSVLNVAGSTIAVLGVAVAIVALTKSSCPFVYVRNGEEFVFQGELYPGAITPNIQRDDYIPLSHFGGSEEDFVIKVSNELKEVQYTDLLQLIVLEHPEGVGFLLDQEGRPHSLSDIEAPKRAFSEGFSEPMEYLLAEDKKSFLFDTDSEAKDGSRTLVMEFSRPAGVKKAKLFLKAKNSFWLDYTFGKFNEKFGSYYATFQKKQLKTPAEESQKWSVEQNIPLSVYLKIEDEWKLIERINTIGPLAFRDLVVPIDLPENLGENVVIKLETGFMFWEIDKAGIDFSENIEPTTVVLEPSFAVDEKGQNVTNLLKRTDGKFLVQPEVGNEVIVNFKYRQNKEVTATTAFLKNRGYYTYIRDYRGIPDFAELRSFKKKGRFSRFAEEQYKEFVAEDMLDLALTYGN